MKIPCKTRAMNSMPKMKKRPALQEKLEKGLSRLKYDLPHEVKLVITVQCNWTVCTYSNI